MTLEEALVQIATLTQERDALLQEKTAYTAHKETLIGEIRALKGKIAEQEQRALKAEEEKLQSEGKYKELFELAEKRRLEREEQDKKLAEEREQARLQAERLKVFGDTSHAIIDLEAFDMLYGARVTRNALGELVVNEKGQDVSLPKFIEAVRETKPFLFKAKGTTGSGATSSGGNPGGGLGTDANPFKRGPGFSLTAQGGLVKTDPIKARALMIEAGYTEAQIKSRLK